MKRLVVLALLFIGVACTREEPAQPTRSPIAPAERENLLTLAAGAVALDRDGEMAYDSSVVHVMDGTSATYWTSPPHGTRQTLTFALPALTRLTQIGAATAIEPGNAVDALDYEVSIDGRTWTPLRILRLEPSHDLQKTAVNAEARFLRVTTGAAENQSYAVVRSIIAEGQELEPARPGSLDGCWSIDGMPARFEQRGSHVSGVILTFEGPLYLDGGLDGRTWLTMWLRAPMWGHAALTVTPDGQHLSILQWHEDVVWDNAGDGYLGKRAPCADAPFQQTAIIDGLLARAGRYALYGAIDETLAATLAATLQRHPSRRFRIVAREFQSGTPKRDLQTLEQMLRTAGADLGRVEFVDAGADPAGRAIHTELERRFVGTMELEMSKGR